MADAVQNAEQEFWRPPIAAPARESRPFSHTDHVCEKCGTEYMVGAQYCHSCGMSREGRAGVMDTVVSSLEFQSIRERLGLPMASLVAFLVGLGCVFAALSIRVIYTPQKLVDWQAIQLYTIEWLLGAMVAFVAGILLKKAR